MKKTKKIKSTKPKYATGGLQQYDGLSNTAQQRIEMLGPEPQTGGEVLGGVSKGAQAGSVAGPWGMLAGAAIGAGMGIMNKKKNERNKEAWEARRQAAVTASIQSGQGLPTFAGGGTIDNGNVVDGGRVKKISRDAVEVQADNPGIVDSVELDTAFVDDGEIIDKKDRVFSDILKAPSGKSIAKEAKKLEKMKSKDERFGAANSRVDQRLDDLFNYQESINKVAAVGKKPRKANGGLLTETDPVPKKKGVPKEVIVKYNENNPNIPTDLTPQIEENDPIIYDKKDFEKYYRNKLVSKLDPDSRQQYEAYETPDQQNSYLALKGGLPNFDIYQKNLREFEKSQITNPTDWTQIDSSAGQSNVGGYRYDAKRGQGLPAIGSITKQKRATGGPIPKFKYDFDPSLIQPYQGQRTSLFSEADIAPPGRVDLNSIDNPQTVNSTTTSGGGTNTLKTLGTGLATYGPDIVNAAAALSLKKMKNPSLERNVQLKRINADAQLAENARLATNTGRLIAANTAQSGVAASNMGAILAKRLYADNAVRNQVNNLNSEIEAREVGMNASIGARNVDRTNMKLMADTEMRNRKLSAISQIASNVGQKALMQSREKNQKETDLATLDVLKTKYGESGIYDRQFADIINKLRERQGTKSKNKMGGKLGRKC